MEKRFEVFEKAVKEETKDHSLKEAFHKVNDGFEQKIGFKVYKSYQSYKNARVRNGVTERRKKKSE